MYALDVSLFLQRLTVQTSIVSVIILPSIYFYFHSVCVRVRFFPIRRERTKKKIEIERKGIGNCVGQFHLSPTTFEIIESQKPIKIGRSAIRTKSERKQRHKKQKRRK